MKIWEWLSERDAWTIYEDKSLKEDFQERVGREPTWIASTARGMQEKIKHEKGGHEVDLSKINRPSIAGYTLAASLAKEYLDYSSDTMGRGFLFRDCIDKLKKAGL